MPSLLRRVKKALSKSEEEIQFNPTSPIDRLAQQGIRPLIMTEQLESRIALMTGLKKLLKDVYNGKTLQDQLDAIDRALPLVLIVSQPWGRGHQVWSTFSAQFRELRTMPAFMDTLIEEFIDMLNHGWLPQDVLTPVPIVMFTPFAQRQPFDLTEFEVSTRAQKSKPPEE